MTEKKFRLGTIALHAGQGPGPTTGSRTVPLYQTTSYVFKNTEHAANLFGLRELGNIYTRLMNPTTDVFEKRIAAIEGGTGAIATASGQAAITYAILNITQPGDEIVSADNLYGGTYELFHYTLPKFGRHVVFVDSHEARGVQKGDQLKRPGPSMPRPSATRNSIRPTSRQSQKSPTSHGIPLVVDNTTGIGLVRPYRPRRRYRRPLGDQVHRRPRELHRRGHRRFRQVCLEQRQVPRVHRTRSRLPRPEVLGRVRELPGPRERCFCLQDPRLAHEGYRGASKPVQLLALPYRPRDPPPAGSPALGERARCRKVPQKPPQSRLGQLPRPSGKPEPHSSTRKYLHGGFGPLVGVGIKGGETASRKFIDSLKLFSNLANIGDSKSLVIHPASTTHQQLTVEEQAKTGVTPDAVRLSIGTEDIEDIIEDLNQALAQV